MSEKRTYEELAKRVQELERLELWHKRIEEELQEKERQLSTLMNNLPGMVYRCKNDPDWTKEFVSNGCKALTGYKPEELIGNALISFGAIIHPDDRQKVWNDVQAALDNKQSFQLVYRIITSDKMEKWVWERGQGIFGSDGTLIALEGFVQDITDQKSAEENLRESETRFRLFAEAAPVGIVISDQDEKTQYMNQKFVDLFGYTLKDMPSVEEWWPLAYPDVALRNRIRQEWNAAVDEARRTCSEIKPMEYPVTCKDGTVRQIEFRAAAVGKFHAVIFTDITERKQIEEGLQKEKAFSDSILNNLPAIFYLFDEKGKFLRWNKRFTEVSGYSAEEIANMHPLEFFEGEGKDIIHQRIKETFVTGKSDAEAHFISKNGSRIPYYFTGARIRQDDTNCLIGMGIDITERKHAEKELRESQELFALTFRSSPTPMALTAVSDEKLMDVNEAFCRLFGLSHEEVIQHTSLELGIWGPENRQKISNIFQEKGMIHNLETKARNRNGEEVYLLLSSEKISIKDDTHILTSLVDITERKQFEREYLELFNGMNDTAFVIGFDGRFLAVNETAVRVLGYSREELLSMGPVDIDPHLKAEDIQRLIEGMKADERQVFETEHKTKNGDIIPVEISSSRVNYQGRPAILSIARNISIRKHEEVEREKLQHQLVQSQKMESVGRLAGGVAHDFNNMLGVILGCTELMLMEMKPGDPFYSDLEEIQKAGMRSADLTRQLLAFARKQTITPKVLDLNDTVEGMLKILRRLIGEDIDLLWKPDADLWPVKMDAAQVDQILANLCVNARSAISGVGKVTIETENVTLDDEYCTHHAGFVPGEYVILAVSDDGCGMDEATKSHIFEPFFTTKGAGEGTGLGLATVYGITKQNNGFINVYSEVEKGTTFKIYIPRHEGSIVTEATQGPIKIPRGQDETVLLVEDDPSILNLGKVMLERLGYTVLFTGDPSQALDLAKGYKGRIHLLMTDVVMPQISGKDLSLQMKVLNPEIKILFMSGYTADIIAHRGILDEEINFIQKPFSMKDLAVKVREALADK